MRSSKPKLLTAQIEKIDPKLGIPAFLVIPQSVRNETWRRNPPKLAPLMQLPTAPIVAPEILNEIRTKKKIKSLGKLKTWQREGAVVRGADGVLRNKQGMPVVWNTRWSRFEPDKTVNFSCVPGKGAHDTQWKPTKDAAEIVGSSPPPVTKTNTAVDSFNTRVSHYLHGSELAKLKALAKANGVWDDKYNTLPNLGLCRMTVVNRIRALVKKGHPVVWP